MTYVQMHMQKGELSHYDLSKVMTIALLSVHVQGRCKCLSIQVQTSGSKYIHFQAGCFLNDQGM